MAKIRDVAITINSSTTASMDMEMPEHASGDLLLAFVNKDSTTGFTDASGTWTSLQAQNSAGAHQACFAKRATSSSETLTLILTLETCMGVVVSVRDVNGTTVADAVPTSVIQSADSTTLPLGGNTSITSGFSDCLIFAWNAGDIGHSPMYLPGWVNLFGGDAGANGGALAYTFQRSSAALTSPGAWSGIISGVDTREILVAVRSASGAAYVDAYADRGVTPATLLSPLSVVGTVDRGTWTSTLSLSTIGSKPTSGDVAATATDQGYNPYRAVTSLTPASSKTVFGGSQFDFSTAEDLTASIGVIFGTWLFATPRDYVDLGFQKHGGSVVVLRNGTAYYAWMISAQASAETKADSRNYYCIEVADTSSAYATSGSPNLTSVDGFLWLSANYYGASIQRLSDLWLLNYFRLAGGSATNPVNFLELEAAINGGSGYVNLFQRVGSSALLFAPLQFGGGDPCHVAINLRTFQYPTKADGVDFLTFHVSNNKMGCEFYGQDRGGGDVDTLHFTNCVFTSDSPYYWRFNASHSANVDIDFSGTSVVNGTVTLRSAVTLSGMAFINCPLFTLNGANLDSMEFLNTKLDTGTVADLGQVTNCSFTKDTGTQHAIEITGTAGDVTLSNVTFTGYAVSDGSTGNEAIYVNIASGSMTISISGGSVPSIRTAGATVIVQNAVTVKVTAKDASSLSVIENVRVLLEADAGGDLPAGESISITRSGSTASVSHTAHGMTNGMSVIIRGATQDEYNGIFTISNVTTNAYDYTVSGTPTTPATGTITATCVILSGLTATTTGILQTTAFNYTSDQPVVGKVRKASSGTLYKTGSITGTITNNGFDATILLISDE